MRYTPVVRNYGTPTVVGGGEGGSRSGEKELRFVLEVAESGGIEQTAGGSAWRGVARRGVERSGASQARRRSRGCAGQVPRVGSRGRAVSSPAECSRYRRRRRACLPARGARPPRAVATHVVSGWRLLGASGSPVTGGCAVASRLLANHVRSGDSSRDATARRGAASAPRAKDPSPRDVTRYPGLGRVLAKSADARRAR